MGLTNDEVLRGLVEVICKCCGHIYKTHGMTNACAYSITPGFGCYKCKGVIKESKP